MLRSLLVVACVSLVSTGCYRAEDCHPGISLDLEEKGAGPDDPVRVATFNEAPWVLARELRLGWRSFENTFLTEGLLNRKVIKLTGTDACDPNWLRIKTPRGASVSATRRNQSSAYAVLCEFDCTSTIRAPDIQVTEVTVDWVPAAAGTELARVTVARLPPVDFNLVVAKNKTAVPSLAVLDRPCEFVHRLSPTALLCDGIVFDSASFVFGAQTTVVAAEGDRWIAVNDGHLALRQLAQGSVVELGSGNAADTQALALSGDHIYSVGDAGLSVLRAAGDGGLTLVSQMGLPLRALAAVDGGVLGVLGADGDQQVCVLQPHGAVSCRPESGVVVGLDQGVWLSSGQVTRILALDHSGQLVVTAEGPTIAHDVAGQLGTGTRFRIRGRPSWLATRSMCAFAEVEQSTLGISVFPEGNLMSDGVLGGFADGDGRQGLRWCTDDAKTKTYVYQAE